MRYLILLLFIPLFCLGQEDIERYKLYPTTNVYTSLLLDSFTGKVWQVQIGINDDYPRMKYVLSDFEWSYSVESLTEKYNDAIKWWEEYSIDPENSPESIKATNPGATSEEYMEEYKNLERWGLGRIGQYKLYPTENLYNFVMVDVIYGHTFQVQWSIDEDKRFVTRID